MIGGAIKFAADFLSNIINDVVNKWMQREESRKRGEAEIKNAIYEDAAKRKSRADKVLEKPIKVGKKLLDGLRNRTDRESTD